MYELDYDNPCPWTGKPKRKFVGLWNLDVAVMEYNRDKPYHSEDYTYTFQDGSTYSVVIETYQKPKTFTNKDWTSGDPPELKHWERMVNTKSFVIDGLGLDGDGKVFRTVGAAKRFVNQHLAECENSN
jgi:hypothetical protein